MKIAVMGAGAVGCYYGAMLALAGHPVTMIGRQAHATAMASNGVILLKAGETHRAPVQATTEPSGVADADLVLISVKSDDTVAAAEAIAPYLKSDSRILSLQNGVDNAERLEAVFGRAVIPAAVYVAVETVAAGKVRHNGRGELVIGTGPASAELARTFAQAGIPTDVSENVAAVLWTKLTVNCAYNALCAIGQLPYGPMVSVNGVAEVMTDVVRECRAVAQAAGISLPDNLIGTVMGLAAAMPSQFSSTAQDLQRRKKTEIEHLNGYVVRTAEKFGLSVPANRTLLACVRLLEEAKRRSA
ncbi:MAG TPA: 2-dehydropantoate 2-reductase [Bosea sp. (in: a-proteobacteria)]|jgi:2-dehydropantoate 2-reductase|uniref:ketopantoate reductase family protein n=1 Tax=Bosea sp. (in: a-proteobacteria) TaxID=1871050 RepID=UPI002E0F938F|nr:2-dehydropantoate 2-reductase [Bosea sp. (in: a-proteobacteria)]